MGQKHADDRVDDDDDDDEDDDDDDDDDDGDMKKVSFQPSGHFKVLIFKTTKSLSIICRSYLLTWKRNKKRAVKEQQRRNHVYNREDWKS